MSSALQTATFEEIRHAVSRICRDYLNGRWKTVSTDQLIVKRISSGLSNYMYYVSLPKLSDDNESADCHASQTSFERVAKFNVQTDADDKNRNELNYNELLSAMGDLNHNKRKRYYSASSVTTSEPEEVLIRIYGQSHGEDALEAMITESVVFALLSERNFGPKLHGIFPGGRIEQFIPARALLTEELAHAKISKKIAEKLSEIHSLDIPMSKEPNWMWKCMNRWQKSLPTILARNDWKDNQIHAEFMRNINYAEEAKWMKSIIEQGQYPVVFCHNDLQEGNILIRCSKNAEETNLCDSLINTSDSNEAVCNNSKRSRTLDAEYSNDSVLSSSDFEEPDLMIIDFEYCAYNYRGYDIANHFGEWAVDYTNPNFPFFYHRECQYPNKEQRRQFIKSYLKKTNENEEFWEPSQKEIDVVETEVEIFRMLSHLFWSLWSVVNVTSNIQFGYWDYAVFRINEYLQLKQNFIAENSAQF